MQQRSNLYLLAAAVLLLNAHAGFSQGIPDPPSNVIATWSHANSTVTVSWTEPPTPLLGGINSYAVFAATGDARNQTNPVWTLVNVTSQASTTLDLTALSLSTPTTMSFEVFTRVLVLQSSASNIALAEWRTADQPDSIVFVSNAVLDASANASYVYQALATHVVASHLEAISYTLLNAPSGMTIQSQTGLVAWKPSAQGTYPVSITAVSTTGATARQDFTITVTSNVGYLSGSVSDSATWGSIAGAIVTFVSSQENHATYQTTTMSDGSFAMRLDQGVYFIHAEAAGYESQYWYKTTDPGNATPFTVRGGDSLEGAMNFRLPKNAPSAVSSPHPVRNPEIILAQNHPNPVTPANGFETVIEYSLDHASQVTLDLYSITGMKSATLVQSTQSAGAHSVMVNASEFPAGVYFYKLTVGDVTRTRKMSIRR